MPTNSPPICRVLRIRTQRRSFGGKSFSRSGLAVSFKFKKANCVIVGTFNIYVVQPRLLVEFGLLKKGNEVKFGQTLTQPGFRFSADVLKSQWTIRPDRLIVATDDFDHDCGKQLATILDKLRWTPVTAVGFNLEFESEHDNLESLYPKTHGPKSLNITQRTVHVAISEQDKIFNLQASMQQETNSLSANIHTDLKTDSQSKDIEKAIQALKQFKSDKERATSLLRTVFKAKISNV